MATLRDEIIFDPGKLARTLKERDLDFAHAVEVFEGIAFTQRDERRDYGEIRYQTYGLLDGRLVMVVWTYRFEARHVISMRKCNEREKAHFTSRLGRP